MPGQSGPGSTPTVHEPGRGAIRGPLRGELQHLPHNTNQQLNDRLGELKQYAYESRLLSEMAAMLQVCLRADEAYQVIERQLALCSPRNAERCTSCARSRRS